MTDSCHITTFICEMDIHEQSYLYLLFHSKCYVCMRICLIVDHVHKYAAEFVFLNAEIWYFVLILSHFLTLVSPITKTVYILYYVT
jgi:hypothetical protein